MLLDNLIRQALHKHLDKFASNLPQESEPEEPEEPEETMTSLDQTKPHTINVADIVYSGEKMTLPAGMSLEEAMDLLKRRAEYERKVVNIVREFEASPQDGAHALMQVLRKKFGWAEAMSVRTLFGEHPPTTLTIQIGFRKTVQVPWGEMRLPNNLGTVSSSAKKDNNGRWKYVAVMKTFQRNDLFANSLMDEVADYLRDNSIYQGKALAVKFFSPDGEPLEMPEPEFMDTAVDENKLAFPTDTEMAIRTNLFTPIQRYQDLELNGIPLKRGILLSGVYGTGKTLTAKVASKFAEANNITFLYVRTAKELACAIQFAKPYAKPAVVIFCEDIDVVVNGKRNQDLNDILNIIDGVDTKSMNLITLLTTNHIENITPAMLRPGRLDAVINIPPPDAEAVMKLLAIYGAGVIPKNADLTAVAKELEGAIPAVIAEVVKRAKLFQLSLQKPGTKVVELSAQALLDSAKTIRGQRDLLAEASGRFPSRREEARRE